MAARTAHRPGLRLHDALQDCPVLAAGILLQLLRHWTQHVGCTDQVLDYP